MSLAFPNYINLPAHSAELAPYEMISLNILQELCVPEVGPTFWGIGKFAPWMSMPEAAMYEDNAVPFWKYDIRLAGKFSGVKPEAISEPMEHRSHNQLWICITAFDAGHVPAAVLF